MRPFTTRVVKRAVGPSTLSAATAVATLAQDAGAAGEVPAWENSTLPVARSVTTAPTWLPRDREASRAPSAAARPRLVGASAVAAAGVRTFAGVASGTAATLGICQSASRAGSMAATATPAPHVNTLSIASAASAVSRRRFATTRPLTRCLAQNLCARQATQAQE